MATYITELLEAINKNPEILTVQLKRKGPGDTQISLLLEAAYDPEKAFILPSSRPPYRPNPKPIGLSESNIKAEVSRFYLYRETQKFTKNKREMLFVEALERVSAPEAEILLAIKEQNLQRLYPNITPEVVCEAGYIPPSAVPALKAVKATPVIEEDPVYLLPTIDPKDLGDTLLRGIVTGVSSEPVSTPAASSGVSLKEQARLYYESSPDKSKAVIMDYLVNTLGLGKNVANNYFYAVKKEYDSKNQSAPLGA